MEDKRCSLPSVSNLFESADGGSSTNKSSPTSKQPCPSFEVSHSSYSRSQAGSEWTLFDPSVSLSCSDPIPELCSNITTPPLQVGARRQASITALPQTTLPVLAPRPQRTNHAEHANTAVQVLPTVQSPEAKSSRKRRHRHEDCAFDGNGPFYDCPSSPVPAKKKKKRASQACDSCRKGKVKCGGTKPCAACKEKGVECKYLDPVPKATDIPQADIHKAIGSLKMTLDLIWTQLERLDQRFTNIESFLPGSPSVTNDAFTTEKPFRYFLMSDVEPSAYTTT